MDDINTMLGLLDVSALNTTETVTPMTHRHARFFYGPLIGFLLSEALGTSDHQPCEKNEEDAWHPIQHHQIHLPVQLTTPPFQHPSAESVKLDYFGEEVAASNTKYRRRRPDRRTTTTQRYRRRTRTPQRKRKPAYDSFYDYDVPRRRPRPTRRRTTTPTYDYYDAEEEEEYDYSYEVTSKPRRKPSRGKPYRNKIRDDISAEQLYSDEQEDLSEELARQQSTTSTTTTEATTTTSTTTTNGTTTTGYGSGGNNTNNITFTYGPPVGNEPNYYGTFTGYGPSNGNENISITYGPPTVSRNDYIAPFLDWYSQYPTNNAVVKRVQDIVGDDNDFHGRFDKTIA